MSEELLPCPACWTDSVMLFRDEESNLRWGECDDPDCSMHGPWRETDEEAIAAWNALPRAPRWTEYDGTEGTLPPSGVIVVVKMKKFRFAASVGIGTRLSDMKTVPCWQLHDISGDISDEYTVDIGDRWMPWPEGGE